MNLFYIGFAGFLGVTLRSFIGETMFNFFPNIIFPYHTLIVNLIGSFLFSYFFIRIKTKKLKISINLQTAIFTGFLGSFTTFSTFSIETLFLFHNEEFLLALIYISLSFFGGIAFAFVGWKLGKKQQILSKKQFQYEENSR